MFVDKVNLKSIYELEEIKDFLKDKGIYYKLADATYIVRDKGKIVGTGSLDGKLLKYFYVDDAYKGLGLMAKIYNAILEDLFSLGYTNHFVFTKPENENIFTSLGLKKVEETDKVLLLEGGFSTYPKWISQIKLELNPRTINRGAIVMNMNPMTLGHKYLIDKSLEIADELIIFVVEEDLSIFPYGDRLAIVKEVYKEDPRVKIFGSGEYIISRNTFPTYFLKEEDDMLSEYTSLDGKIFASKIAKDLDIKCRFFGEEPIDRVTANYNRSLEEILKGYGIKTYIFPRKNIGEKIISASYVRDLIRKENNLWKDLLVKPSIRLLESKKGKTIIERLKKDLKNWNLYPMLHIKSN